MPADTEAMRAGARNLLCNCAGVKPGHSVLFVRETLEAGYYDEASPDCVIGEAERLGAKTLSIVSPLVASPDAFPQALYRAMEDADHTIFFSRLGDQMRFANLKDIGSVVMCYALDSEILGAPVCRVPYQLSVRVLAKLQTELDAARHWRITCPLGTDVSGRSNPHEPGKETARGFSLRLFPLGPFRPIPCESMTGTLVTQWLPPVVTHRYEPFGIGFESPVSIAVEAGRITGFEGEERAVAGMRSHYRRLAKMFSFADPYTIFSWHGGANPQILYPRLAADDIERWNGVVHSHPRYTHFHSCGDTPPGEIAIAAIDPTIEFDGTLYWDRGRLVFLERADVRDMLSEYPGFENAFEMSRSFGL
jgi:hypothetical protein